MSSSDVGEASVEFLVPDMSCMGCVRKIERGLADLDDVRIARANLSTRRVRVQLSENHSEKLDLVKHLQALGFTASAFEPGEAALTTSGKSNELLLPMAVAGFAAANIMLLSVSIWSGAEAETAKLFQLISGLIAIPAVAFAGQPFFHSAARAVRSGSLNMDVPISLAVILALGISLYEALAGTHETYFDAAVTLLFFLLIGRYLDSAMRDRARLGVERLMRLMPLQAAKVTPDGSVNLVAIADVETNDHILVRTGERVPVDGIVIHGESDVDRSIVSGEAEPQFITREGDIEAGVLNLTAPLTIKVTKSADQSFVAETVKLMEAAEQSKSRYVRIADRAAQIYAPLIHLLAAVTFLGWLWVTGGDWHTSLYIAISVLIITCPCALGLAVPVAHVVAANRLHREGMLVKDGAGLEKLASVDAVLFDKTGTLTSGVPIVRHAEVSRQQDCKLVAALAYQSNHPMARAISNWSGECGAVHLQCVQEFPGAGIQATHNGKCIRLGKRSWVQEIAKYPSEAESCDGAEHLTHVCFAVEGQSLSIFYLDDAIRPLAKEAIRELTHKNYACAIISGDRRAPVEDLGRELGIDDLSWELRPADKVDEVNTYRQRGRSVLYVGDGINDAPALTAADTSIAPSSASDIGRQSADFVFLGKKLDVIPMALAFAKQTRSVVRSNFALAIAYNLIAIPLAIAGLVTPLTAAIAMSASSILVVANSLRLNWIGYNTPNNPDMVHETVLVGPELAKGQI